MSLTSLRVVRPDRWPGGSARGCVDESRGRGCRCGAACDPAQSDLRNFSFVAGSPLPAVGIIRIFFESNTQLSAGLCPCFRQCAVCYSPMAWIQPRGYLPVALAADCVRNVKSAGGGGCRGSFRSRGGPPVERPGSGSSGRTAAQVWPDRVVPVGAGRTKTEGTPGTDRASPPLHRAVRGSTARWAHSASRRRRIRAHTNSSTSPATAAQATAAHGAVTPTSFSWKNSWR